MMAKNRIEVVCLNCGKIFESFYSEDKKYCSKKCFYTRNDKFKEKEKCAYCGKEFFKGRRNKNFCSKECRYNFHKTLIFSCQYCGKDFSVQACRRKKGEVKYCSRECSSKARIGKTKKKICVCIYCGKEFLVIPYVLKIGRKYCSKECDGKSKRGNGRKLKEQYLKYKNKNFLFNNYVNEHKNLAEIAKIVECSETTISRWMKEFCIETRKGEVGVFHHNYGKPLSSKTKRKISESHFGIHTGSKNPAWKGGISFLPYCPKFNESLKEEIREKFGRVCFLCGKTEEENKRKLSVHHINFDKMSGCYGRRWNLISLCTGCHTKTSIYRFNYFNLLINYWFMNEEINFNYTGDFYWEY